MISASRVFLLLIIAFVTIALSSRADAATPASVSGSVRNASQSAPIAGASVTLTSANGVKQTAVSGADGSFTISGLAAGQYVLTATAKQFQPPSPLQVSLDDGQQLIVAVQMQPVTTTEISTLGHITVKGKPPVNTSSSANTTLSNNDMLNTGTLQVQNALDTLPGFTVERFDNGAPGAVTTFAIRGAGGKGSGTDGTGNTGYEILVLQDGEPLRNGLFGDFDTSSLTPAIYQRVEVVSGVGGTSLFGANTIGGTVNLVTRDPLRTEGGELIFGVGTYGTTDWNISESNTLGRFGYLLNLHRYGTDGFVPGPFKADFCPFCFSPGAIGDIAHPGQTLNLKSGLGKLRYDFSSSSFAVLTVSDEADYRDQVGLIGNPTIVGGNSIDPLGLPYFFGFPGDFVWNMQPKYALDFHTQLGGGSLILRYYNQYIQRVVDGLNEPPDLCCFETRSVDHLGGELVSWTKPLGNHLLTLSFGGNGDAFFASGGGLSGFADFNALNVTATGKQTERTYLVRDDWQTSPKFDVTLAGYYSDYDTLNVKRFDPRLGLVYKPDAYSAVRASVGTGFAPPRLSDIFSPLDLAARDSLPSNITGPGLVSGCPAGDPDAPFCVAPSGNSSIQTETATGFDVGYERAFNGGSDLSVGLYRTNLSNHIFQGLVNPPAGLMFSDGTAVFKIQKPINLAHAVYTGIELGGRLAVTQNFSLAATYNTQAAYPVDVDVLTQQQLGDVVNNQQFLDVPLHKENATLGYHNRAGTSAFLQWNFYGPGNAFNVPSFSVYNAGINLPAGKDTIHIAWQNIFDKNDTLFSTFNGGVPYPGFSGPFSTTAFNSPAHMITVTFDHRWGALR